MPELSVCTTLPIKSSKASKVILKVYLHAGAGRRGGGRRAAGGSVGACLPYHPGATLYLNLVKLVLRIDVGRCPAPRTSRIKLSKSFKGPEVEASRLPPPSDEVCYSHGIVTGVHTKFLDPSLLCFTAVPLRNYARSCARVRACIGATHPYRIVS